MPCNFAITMKSSKGNLTNTLLSKMICIGVGFMIYWLMEMVYNKTNILGIK